MRLTRPIGMAICLLFTFAFLQAQIMYIKDSLPLTAQGTLSGFAPDAYGLNKAKRPCEGKVENKAEGLSTFLSSPEAAYFIFLNEAIFVTYRVKICRKLIEQLHTYVANLHTYIQNLHAYNVLQKHIGAFDSFTA